MKRVALAGIIALAATVAAVAWSHKTRMVRVGGEQTACHCTQRIEP